MICHFNPISDNEYLLNRLKMLSSISIQKLADRLEIPEKEILLLPDFKSEAEKMINEITF